MIRVHGVSSLTSCDHCTWRGSRAGREEVRKGRGRRGDRAMRADQSLRGEDPLKVRPAYQKSDAQTG